MDVEPNETFTITLGNAQNVSVISNAIATVTIANDDATVQFNSATTSVNESAGFVNVTVTRVGDTSRPAFLRFRSSTMPSSKAMKLSPSI